jgi:hypothetical protein
LIKIELFGHRLTGGASGGAALNIVDVESGMP